MSRTRSLAQFWFCLAMLLNGACKRADHAAGGGGRDAGESTKPVDAGAVDSSPAEHNMHAGDIRDAGATGQGGKDAAAASGTGGAGAADEDAGSAPQAGSGGDTGSSPGDPAFEQCLSDAHGAGQQVDACTRCLCRADKCRGQLDRATHDPKANAVVICSQNEHCTDTCCLCTDKTCSLSNYGSGACTSELKIAAGVAANSGIDKAITVSNQCAREGAGDNPCRRAAVLAHCALEQCPSECPIAVTCQ